LIFVTVGTISFDDLVRHMDEAVSRGELTDVLLQIGSNGIYIPKHCEYFRARPGIDEYYRAADLVVGHGGTGTTLGVLEIGTRLVSVRNPTMSADHQDEFLSALERLGLVSYCRNLADLPTVIRRRLQEPKPPPCDVTRFFCAVVSDLEHFEKKASNMRM